MPEGFEVYNEDGSVRNTMTNFFGKVLGQANFSGFREETTWPYPEVPAANRAIYCFSNAPFADRQICISYAVFADEAKNIIYYSQDMDKAPITIVFMQY